MSALLRLSVICSSGATRRFARRGVQRMHAQGCITCSKLSMIWELIHTIARVLDYTSLQLGGSMQWIKGWGRLYTDRNVSEMLDSAQCWFRAEESLFSSLLLHVHTARFGARFHMTDIFINAHAQCELV